MAYRGRFAPSPTGPLHFGSLVAAVASFLDAKAHNGSWLVRIEDVDEPRSRPGAAEDILCTLERFGLLWDGPVEFQSRRKDRYEMALAKLRELGVAYGCACTRRSASSDTSIYPGTCRNGLPSGQAARSWRVRINSQQLCFNDRLQGTFCQNLEAEVGDFIIKRADGFHAYQLAVVVDDAEQHITDVVRGADLLDNTPRQIYLQQLLGMSSIRYLHVPVAVNEEGQKLSKQTGATAVDIARPGEALIDALEFLGQQPLSELRAASPHTIIEWAVAKWRPDAIPNQRSREMQL
ncbi:MAG TPA: tRNA glutamyl-Q(34) synthetase GluQRS [Bryobacteraceae bacterium]|nr:tRNA glutamyl-Q(34) synthetase GluQRS [Bryobacteraceae bacterium]